MRQFKTLNYNRRLTENQVREIFLNVVDSHGVVARKYHVSKSTIRAIRGRTEHKWITEELI